MVGTNFGHLICVELIDVTTIQRIQHNTHVSHTEAIHLALGVGHWLPALKGLAWFPLLLSRFVETLASETHIFKVKRYCAHAHLENFSNLSERRIGPALTRIDL